MRRSGRSRRAGFAVAVTAGALLALAPAMAASAHNSVTGTTPAEGEVVTTQPGEVGLSTSDELLDLGSGNRIDVIGPDGLHYATGCAVIAGSDASAPAELGEAGEYTVEWRVVSADGHPISGEYAFEWAPAEGETLAEGSTSAACGGTGGSDDSASTDAADAPAPPSAGDAGFPADAVWIGVAALVVIAAGVVTWLVARRRTEASASRDDAGRDDRPAPGA